MGAGILKGVTAGLLGTVITLAVVLGLSISGINQDVLSYVVDFGLVLSCLAAGYRSASQSSRIVPAVAAAGCFVLVSILLLALYFPIAPWGAVKVFFQSLGLGLAAGFIAVGQQTLGGNRSPVYEGRRAAMTYTPFERGEWGGPRAVGTEEERRNIYRLCNKSLDEMEEDNAFAWWELEEKRRSKERLPL